MTEFTPSGVAPEGPTGPSAPRPAKKKNVLLVVGLLVGVPLLLCLGLVGLGAVISGTAKKAPLRPGDRAALVTVGDLLAAAGSDAEVDATKEVTSREKDLFDSVDVTYEYEQVNPPMFVSTTISLEPDEDTARTAFVTSSAGAGVGVALSGDGTVKLEERPGLLHWGDQVKTSLLTASGKPTGNFVVVRKGKRVFTSIFAGVYFEDGDALQALLEPKLEAMMKLER